MHVPQYLPALHQTRSRILKVSSIAFWGYTLGPRSFVMDDATLKRFETFHIGSSQNLSEHEASYYAESEPGNISKPGHSTTLPLETSNECTLSPPTNSHQCPPGQPLRQTRTARKNKRAVKAQEVPSRGSYDQPGQDPLFPQQASNPSQCLSGPGLKSPGGTGTRAQRRQYNSKASCFVPQSPCTKAAHSETELLAHRQKVCLSVFYDWGHPLHCINNVADLQKLLLPT